MKLSQKVYSIKELRLNHKFTLAKVAKALDMSTPTYVNLEKGAGKLLSKEQLLTLAHMYHVKPDNIVITKGTHVVKDMFNPTKEYTLGELLNATDTSATKLAKALHISPSIISPLVNGYRLTSHCSYFNDFVKYFHIDPKKLIDTPISHREKKSKHVKVTNTDKKVAKVAKKTTTKKAVVKKAKVTKATKKVKKAKVVKKVISKQVPKTENPVVKVSIKVSDLNFDLSLEESAKLLKALGKHFNN